MQRIFRLIHKEINGLHQAAFLLAFASFGAKVLALFRDRLLASHFGASQPLDIYYASFRVADLLYVFSLFLVSTTALIPLFIEKKETDSDGHDFINGIFSVFSVVILFSIGIAFFAIPFVIHLIAPGFSSENQEVLIKLSRIMLLSPLFLGLSNLVASVLQSFKRFFVYALSGVVYNFGIIFGIVFLQPHFGLSGVALGVIIGAFFHFLIQVPTLIKLGYFPKIYFTKSVLDYTKKVAKLSFPRALGLTLNQLVLTVITALASLLAAGSISVFNLASNLQAIPIGIIALSYSVAAFPSLAKSHIKKEKEKFLSSVVSSFRHIVFWLLPIGILFVVLRAQIVRVVLGAGNFGWEDTRLTAAALALFAVSLFAQGLILLLVRAFYAANKTKLPLFVNIISSFCIILFSVCFLLCFKHFPNIREVFRQLLRVGDIGTVSVLVLPLAYSLGTMLNFLLLYLFFEKKFGAIFYNLKKSFLQVLAASLLMGFVAYNALSVFACIFNINTFAGIFTQGFLAGISALLVGFLLLRFLKNEELEELLSVFKRKILKKMPTKPEPEELP